MFKALLVALMFLYTIMPYDLLPDFIPVGGWLDDLFLLGVLIYYFKQGKLPAFFSRSGSHSQSERSRTDGGSRAKPEGRRVEKDPFEILGVKPGARPEEIRSAYRRVVQEYHPDKVSHLGPELQELAKQKFIEIQEAYETLMKNQQ